MWQLYRILNSLKNKTAWLEYLNAKMNHLVYTFVCLYIYIYIYKFSWSSHDAGLEQWWLQEHQTPSGFYSRGWKVFRGVFLLPLQWRGDTLLLYKEAAGCVQTVQFQRVSTAGPEGRWGYRRQSRALKVSLMIWIYMKDFVFAFTSCASSLVIMKWRNIESCFN